MNSYLSVWVTPTYYDTFLILARLDLLNSDVIIYTLSVLSRRRRSWTRRRLCARHGLVTRDCNLD